MNSVRSFLYRRYTTELQDEAIAVNTLARRTKVAYRRISQAHWCRITNEIVRRIRVALA